MHGNAQPDGCPPLYDRHYYSASQSLTLCALQIQNLRCHGNRGWSGINTQFGIRIWDLSPIQVNLFIHSLILIQAARPIKQHRQSNDIIKVANPQNFSQHRQSNDIIKVANPQNFSTRISDLSPPETKL